MKWLFLASLILVMDVFVFGQAKVAVHKAEFEEKPLASDKVPEAVTGFRSPVDFTSSRAGYDFLQKTAAKGANAYPATCVPGRSLYHPGWDMNKTGGDKNEPVYAAADGVVVYIGPYTSVSSQHPGTVLDGVETRGRSVKGNGWSAIVLQHNYNGVIYFTNYGHANNVPMKLTLGSVVKKGDIIALLDNIETKSPHLHFEIRNANHPNPTRGDYFCQRDSNDTNEDKRGTLQVKENVEAWYVDPDPNHDFIKSLKPYSKAPAKPIDTRAVAGTGKPSKGSVAGASTTTNTNVTTTSAIATPQPKTLVVDKLTIKDQKLQGVDRRYIETYKQRGFFIYSNGAEIARVFVSAPFPGKDYRWSDQRAVIITTTVANAPFQVYTIRDSGNAVIVSENKGVPVNNELQKLVLSVYALADFGSPQIDFQEVAIDTNTQPVLGIANRYFEKYGIPQVAVTKPAPLPAPQQTASKTPSVQANPAKRTSDSGASEHGEKKGRIISQGMGANGFSYKVLKTEEDPLTCEISLKLADGTPVKLNHAFWIVGSRSALTYTDSRGKIRSYFYSPSSGEGITEVMAVKAAPRIGVLVGGIMKLTNPDFDLKKELNATGQVRLQDLVSQLDAGLYGVAAKPTVINDGLSITKNVSERSVTVVYKDKRGIITKVKTLLCPACRPSVGESRVAVKTGYIGGADREEWNTVYTPTYKNRVLGYWEFNTVNAAAARAAVRQVDLLLSLARTDAEFQEPTFRNQIKKAIETLLRVDVLVN